MVSAEEFEAAWTPEAIIRDAVQSDEPYTQQLAARCRDLSRLFGDDLTMVKFRLLDSLTILLARFVGECRGQGLTGIANVDVWGTEWDWLADARRGIMQILTQKKPLRQEHRVAAFRLYDLLAILFGDEWSWDDEGKFAQLVVGISQVELEVALELLIHRMEQTPAAEAQSAGEGKAEVERHAVSQRGSTPEPRSAGVLPTDAAAASSTEAAAQPEELQTATLTAVCSILQTTIKFLTSDGDEDGDGRHHWPQLPAEAIAKIYEFLVSAYSVLLNYFISRQGVVRDDVDVICIGLLEDLMQDLDADLFAEEAETVREMLQTSGYYDEAAKEAA